MSRLFQQRCFTKRFSESRRMDLQKLLTERTIGDIMHTSNCGAYTAIMPSKGTGTFVVSDNGINIKGEMQKGKIAKLNDFYELGTPSRIALHFPEEKTHAIRQHIESILEMTKKGSLKIQNLTSVMLRKALQFLPK